jgi:hypothetical protein
MPIPEGLDVLQSGDSVVIRRSWRTWAVLVMIPFLIFWFGFLGFWYYHAFTDPKAPLMMFLFPLLHLAAGVALAYFMVCSLVNYTDVMISGSRVRCVIGPLPWWGSRDLPSEDIRGVTVRERWGNKGSVSYTVMVVDASNRERTLLSATPRREQADFIAASIREILGLDGSSAMGRG